MLDGPEVADADLALLGALPPWKEKAKQDMP